MESKNILIFIPTLHGGGAERVVSTLANEWIKHNNKVIICLLNDDNIHFSLDARITILKIGTVNIFKPISYIIGLRRILKYYKPDIIQSFLTEYNILALIANLGLKSKIYVSDRANPYVNRGFGVELLRSILYKFADGIIAQTKAAKAVIFKKTVNRNIKVIANPITIPNLPLNIKREKIILNIGRLIPEKGQLDLIQIFYKSELFKSGWRLIIIGGGPLLNELKESIDELNLSSKIELKGEVKNIRPYLLESSIFAFTSYSEGFPNALLESMAYGLTVISYDCHSGPSDLITNKVNGILIPSRDEKLYIRSLIELTKNDSLIQRYSSNAIQESYKYNSISISKQWFDFITA
jgi:GalNAc-alpha-(1->4)-GalNAc-alpha-(1->3)-diNAcBac-PP-undecaprenol alpha-1,4-N-acetyl-D-galactosaminyltransferase